MRQQQSDGHYDVVVVGAGVIGLSAAWMIARDGGRVAVVDSGEPGQAATRTAAGMLAPVAEAAFGEERLLAMTLRAAEGFGRFVADLEADAGMEVERVECGSIHVALDRDEAAELRRRHRYIESLGLEADWLAPRACRELEPGLVASFHGGVRVPAESAVDPRRLTTALVTAMGDGVDSLFGQAVAEAILDGDRLTGVRLEGGAELGADRVVDATGSRSGTGAWLPDEARVPVRPVKGQILELGPRAESEPVLNGIVATERVYLVPRPDGRLAIGATVEEQGFDTSVTAGGVYELLREAYRAVPDIAEMELLEATAGLRPATPDNLPIIGAGALDGLIHATGHYRNGILLAPLTAAAVLDLVRGRPVDEAVAAADPGRFAASAQSGGSAAPGEPGDGGGAGARSPVSPATDRSPA